MKKLIFLNCLCLVFIISGCSSKVYNEAIEHGDIKFEEGNYGEALTFYKKALEEKPNDETTNEKIEELKNSYENDLRNVVSIMLSESSKAEEMISTYSRGWSYIIKNNMTARDLAELLDIRRNHTTLYFKQIVSITSDYLYKGDSQAVIRGISKYYQKIGKNEELELKKDEVASLIRKLNNPPQEYKDAYDIAFELYSNYENYISFALSPSGSLISYNQKANEVSSNIVTKIREFEVKLPLK